MRSVESALGELREYWGRGADSQRRYADFSCRGDKLSEQARLGLSGQCLRTMRLFAKRCPEQELNDIIRRCREAGYALSHSALVKIYEVTDKDQRQHVLGMAIDRKMSSRAIADLVQGRRYHREKVPKGTGRNVRRFRSFSEGKQCLTGMAAKWEKVVDAVSEWAADGPELTEARRKSVAAMAQVLATLRAK